MSSKSIFIEMKKKIMHVFREQVNQKKNGSKKKPFCSCEINLKKHIHTILRFKNRCRLVRLWERVETSSKLFRRMTNVNNKLDKIKLLMKDHWIWRTNQPF